MSGLTIGGAVADEDILKNGRNKVPRWRRRWRTTRSLAPLLVLTVVVLGSVNKKPMPSNGVVGQMRSLVGAAATATFGDHERLDGKFEIRRRRFPAWS